MGDYEELEMVLAQALMALGPHVSYHCMDMCLVPAKRLSEILSKFETNILVSALQGHLRAFESIHGTVSNTLHGQLLLQLSPRY
jgi:hypothetical protein